MIKFKHCFTSLFLLSALVLTGCGGGGGGGSSGSTASSGGGGTGGGGGGGLIAITCTGGGTTGTGNPSSIVGSWSSVPSASDPRDLFVISFFSDGTYMVANDVDVVKHPTELVGMERGTYTWDATTGAFTPTVTVNTNGKAGFGGLTSNLCVAVNGDKLTVRDNTETGELTRVADVANSIVGTWTSGDRTKADDLSVMTFFNDFTYIMANDVQFSNTGHDGMERGTYNWIPSSGAFTYTTTVDTDGDVGLSGSSSGCDKVQVSNNVMTLTCPDPDPNRTQIVTFTRVTS